MIEKLLTMDFTLEKSTQGHILKAGAWGMLALAFGIHRVGSKWVEAGEAKEALYLSIELAKLQKELDSILM